MKRRERTRLEKVRRVAVLTGLSFALGALVDAGLTWRLHEFDPGESGPAPVDVRPAALTPAPPHGMPSVSTERPAATTGFAAPTTGSEAAVTALRDRDLIVPVRGVERSDLRDSYADARSGH